MGGVQGRARPSRHLWSSEGRSGSTCLFHVLGGGCSEPLKEQSNVDTYRGLD